MKREETYTIKVICKNCGHQQELEIKKGKRFTEGNYFNGGFSRIGGTDEGYFYDTQVNCQKCGCSKLVKLM